MENPHQTLKNIFTSYWHFLALQNACKLDIFDVISEQKYTFFSLKNELKLAEKPLFYLISFLEEEQYIEIKNDFFSLTQKGILLTKNHPESLKNACLLWGEEHLNAWQNLDFTLKTQKPAFENLYQLPFFEYLQKNPKKLENYHLAMCEYAHEDYKNMAEIIDFSTHKTITDIGGSSGVLIQNIAKKNPKINCILFDLPEVISIFKHQKKDNFDIISGDFFEKMYFKTDAIILSRILHDWNDENCCIILENCKEILQKNGIIYIIENLQNEQKTHLLSLNMMLMCESFERTKEEYQKLLQYIDFEIIDTKKLNNLQTILICKNEL